MCYDRRVMNLWPKSLDWTILASMLLGLGFGGVIWYVDYRQEAVEKLETEIVSLETTVETLDRKITDLGEIFLSTLTEEQKKNESLMDQFEEITDSVKDLEKLSETDPELLQKYSKVFFLNEHYIPVSLSKIDEDNRSANNTNFQIHSDVLPFLEDLMDEARDDDLNLLVQSAYRSFGTQSTLKATYTVSYGSTAANRFSADQGYSEHQLGTTVDFTTGVSSGALEGFDKTPEYVWLLENAHKYGFILSYPAGNTFYKFEPWHWRFVGVSLARKLHNNGTNFYDADQRLIDSYLVKIFD